MLECFTQTLPDSQADLLWDNVQFLNDSEMSGDDKEEGGENPQVFLLSGWGEPGSAPSDEEEELPKEGDATTPNDPPASWPEAGEVAFKDVEMAYRPGLPAVLKGVTFDVKAGEKVRPHGTLARPLRS